MTADYTSLEVSRRLAEVWPARPRLTEPAWWYGKNGRAIHTAPGRRPVRELGLVRARTLSELEAETKRMGLWYTITNDPSIVEAPIHFNLFPNDRRFAPLVSVVEVADLIDVWGEALARAKEKV